MDFTQEYNRTSWLNFLDNTFLPDDFRITEETVPYQKEFSKKVTKLGECPSLQLTVFEMSHTSVNDARVGLSKEAFTLVRDYTKYNRALALFIPQTSNETYRFSYVEFTPELDEAGKIKRKISNPRRYSYLLGKDCKEYTPAKYLIKEGVVKAQTRNAKKFSAIDDLVYRFSVEVLTNDFYNRLYNWYEWALTVVRFPEGSGRNVKLTSKDNEMHLIRLITRLIFVWFIKQKNLIPEWIFDKIELNKTLKNFKPDSIDSGDYYNGILQNLFFATLNNEIKERAFTKDTKKYGNEQFGVKFFYRDRKEDSYFKVTTDEIINKFSSIPFLNGGLFECLDKNYDNPKKPGADLQEYHDGFSREKKCCAFVPDILFFNDIEKDKQAGLISLFNLYNFTIEENTPVDVDVALDPELLGKVFENLLGYYNEETKTTARKESGSFYTPREIVDYMVTESLKSYSSKNISFNEKKYDGNFIEKLLSYSEEIPDIELSDKKQIIKLIDECKILDPACGSGAFPMGVLTKFSLALSKFDKDGKLWRERQEERAQKEAKEAITIDNQDERDIKLKEISETFEFNKTEYGHKLYLIENCLFGVDIKPIAIQITKLRFFISLIVEQERDDSKYNYGIRPLPNLETKFICANSLIGLSEQNKELLDLEDEKIQSMKKTLWNIREQHFYAQKLFKKKELRNDDKKQRNEIKKYLLETALKPDIKLIADNISQIAKLEIQRETVKNEKLVDISKINTNLFDSLNDGLPQYVDMNLEKRNMIDAELKRLRDQNEKEKNKSDNKTIHVDIDRIADWDPYDQNAEAAQFFDPYWMFNVESGFYVVIGNPPYIQLQNNHGELANMYQNCDFNCFIRTGDIYQLFYEKGINLLRQNGHLCFITSNKWMRAAYGEKTRNFFADKANPKILIDFAGQKVFASATVDVNIILLEKKENEQKTVSCIIKDDCKNNMTGYIKQHGNSTSFPANGQSWVILSDIEKRIKEKIEKIGKPLKDWDINIYRGILTGCNEAFIIDKQKRDELIKKDKKSAEIIRPILRGRDIARYQANFADLYLINTHNGIPSKNIPPIDVNKYPAIKEHLDKYWTSIKNRDDQGITPYNLRSCAYMDDFSKQKIVYPNMTKFLPFYYDTQSYLTNQKCFIITGENIAFLIAFLNSSLFKFCFRDNFPELKGGTRELSKIFFDNISVIKVNNETNKIFKTKIIEIQKLKEQNVRTKDKEIEIDNMIFDLYQLTEKERKIIDFIEIQ